MLVHGVSQIKGQKESMHTSIPEDENGNVFKEIEIEKKVVFPCYNMVLDKENIPKDGNGQVMTIECIMTTIAWRKRPRRKRHRVRIGHHACSSMLWATACFAESTVTARLFTLQTDAVHMFTLNRHQNMTLKVSHVLGPAALVTWFSDMYVFTKPYLPSIYLYIYIKV